MAEWPEEHSRALTEFLSRGMSRAKIAAAINGQFNTSYSRNAVIGRACRMELVPPDKPVKEAKKHGRCRNVGPQVQKINRKRQGDHHAVLRISAAGNGSMHVIESRESAAVVKLRCVEIVPRHLSLLDLERNDCRYPAHAACLR